MKNGLRVYCRAILSTMQSSQLKTKYDTVGRLADYTEAISFSSRVAATARASCQSGRPSRPPCCLQDKDATATENLTARCRPNPLLKARAIENQAYVIGANRVGSDSKGTLYSGNSLIYGPQGQIITEFETDKERIDTFILSYRKLKDIRKKFPALEDADDFEILADNE